MAQITSYMIMTSTNFYSTTFTTNFLFTSSILQLYLSTCSMAEQQRSGGMKR